MLNTVHRYLANLASEMDRRNLQPIIDAGSNLDSSTMLTGAGLAIHGASSPLVKAGSACYYMANGVLNTIAANTDLTALSGTVTNGTYNVFVFYGDQFGAVTVGMGTNTAAATLNAVVFPAQPLKKTCLGFVIIHPTGTGNFVGGTSNLDDATIIPNAVYISTTGSFDPSVLIG